MSLVSEIAAAPVVVLLRFRVTPGSMSLMLFVARLKEIPFIESDASAAEKPDGMLLDNRLVLASLTVKDFAAPVLLSSG